MLLLILGVVGIGYALYHAASGGGRCQEQCEDAGYAKSHYTAPISGNRARCACIAEDGSHVPLP